VVTTPFCGREGERDRRSRQLEKIGRNLEKIGRNAKNFDRNLEISDQTVCALVRARSACRADAAERGFGLGRW